MSFIPRIKKPTRLAALVCVPAVAAALAIVVVPPAADSSAFASTQRSTSTVTNGVISLDAANPVSRIALNNIFRSQLIASDPALGAAFFQPQSIDGATGSAVVAVRSDETVLFDSRTFTSTNHPPTAQSSGGSGTPSDPFWIASTASVEDGPGVGQKHSYIEGDDFVRTDLTYTNRGDAAESIQLSGWGDCYFAGSDFGYSEVQPDERIATCKSSSDGPFISFVAASPDASLAAGHYTQVLNAVRTYSPLPNDCIPAGSCDTHQDNGMAVAFRATVQPGETVTKTYFTKYSRDMRLTNLAARFEASRSSMLVGEDITFTIGVSNDGAADATNAHAEFLLPEGFEYVSSTPSAGTTYDSATGNWDLGTLLRGASVSLAVTARATVHGEATFGLTSLGSDAIDLNACTALGDPACGGTAQVTVNQELVPGNATVAASPRTVLADGATPSTVTVTLRDRQGNPIAESGHNVAFAATVGSIGDITDHGDGTYSAPWTSTNLGRGTASFTVDGAASASTATVDFIAGDVSLDVSSAEVTEGDVAADGRTPHMITLTLSDAAGHAVSGHADDLSAATTDDLGDGEITGFAETATAGTYTAVITSTVPGTKVITAALAGSEIPMTGNDKAAFVEVTGGSGSGSESGSGSGSGSGASGPPTVSSSPTAASLARTGSDLTAAIAVAAAAMVAGAGLFWFALLRRRRTSE